MRRAPPSRRAALWVHAVTTDDPRPPCFGHEKRSRHDKRPESRAAGERLPASHRAGQRPVVAMLPRRGSRAAGTGRREAYDWRAFTRPKTEDCRELRRQCGGRDVFFFFFYNRPPRFSARRRFSLARTSCARACTRRIVMTLPWESRRKTYDNGRVRTYAQQMCASRVTLCVLTRRRTRRHCFVLCSCSCDDDDDDDAVSTVVVVQRRVPWHATSRPARLWV